VYYANYLKYFERARTEYMNQRGVDLAEYHRGGIFFMVADAKITYRSPAHYGETLIIDAWISRMGGASFVFQYRVMEKTSRRLIAEGETTIVTADEHQKLKRLTPELRERLQVKQRKE